MSDEPGAERDLFNGHYHHDSAIPDCAPKSASASFADRFEYNFWHAECTSYDDYGRREASKEPSLRRLQDGVHSRDKVIISFGVAIRPIAAKPITGLGSPEILEEN